MQAQQRAQSARSEQHAGLISPAAPSTGRARICKLLSHLAVFGALLWSTGAGLANAQSATAESDSAARATAAAAIDIAPGAGSFVFTDLLGDASKPITVFTYVPKGAAAQSVPIVFVMHGHSKDAKGYRDTWIELADQYGFMVVAPHFAPPHWASGAYAYSSVFAGKDVFAAESNWSFTLIDHLFDTIKTATANANPRYMIYGHSEGGQFVHRLVLLRPDAKFSRAAIANPGWYTMPSFAVRYPYGLLGSPATPDGLRRSLGRDVVLLLGDQDNDPNHPELRRTPQAMAQGTNRFARGQAFFTQAEQAAKELGSPSGGQFVRPFAWQLRVVPGAGHDNAKMSRAAAAALMER